MGAILGSPVFWNLVTLSIVMGFVLTIWRSRQQPLWAEAYRRLRYNRLGIVALLFIVLYTTVGVLDSIAWRDNRTADPRSIIDRIFQKERERTYSAPRARRTRSEVVTHSALMQWGTTSST